jgi:hypothetical protein
MDKILAQQIGRVRVNGHVMYFNHLTNLKRISKSTWQVTRNSSTYTISGGRHAGGPKDLWFVDFPESSRPVQCVSLADALRMLDGM